MIHHSRHHLITWTGSLNCLVVVIHCSFFSRLTSLNRQLPNCTQPELIETFHCPRISSRHPLIPWIVSQPWAAQSSHRGPAQLCSSRFYPHSSSCSDSSDCTLVGSHTDETHIEHNV